MKTRGLTIDETAKVKGVACILLIIHHLFNSNYTFKTLLTTGKWNYMDNFVSFAKVCVILFLVISGYGLSEQFERKNIRMIKSVVKFVYNHIIKLYLTFWVIYLIFVPMGIFFGHSFAITYEGSIKNMLLDFFALSYLLNTPMANRTWWYISVMLIYYILFPFAFYIIKRFKSASVVLFIGMAGGAYIFVGKRLWYIYFIPFLFGMILSRYDFFSRIDNLWKTKTGGDRFKIVIYLAALLIYSVIRTIYLNDRMFYYVFDWVFALIIILIIRDVKWPDWLSKVLSSLGTHSGNIFMFHTFFFSIYMTRYVYWPEYAGVIFFTFLGGCVLVSILLEKFKAVSRYNRLYQILRI